MMNIQTQYKVKVYQKVMQTMLLRKATHEIFKNGGDFVIKKWHAFFMAEWRKIYKRWHKTIVKI